MKIKEVLSTLEGLSSIAKKKMPAPVTYALLKNIKKLEAEQAYFIKMQDTLLDECVKRTEDGMPVIVEDTTNQFVLKEDKIKYYNEEFKKIMDIDAEIEIQTVPFSAIANLELSLEEMSALDFMLKTEE